MARRGAASLRSEGNDEPLPVAEERRAVDGRGDGPAWQPEEVWVEDDDRTPAPRRRQGPPATLDRDLATRDGSVPAGHRRSVPAPVVAELTRADPDRGTRLAARLGDAAHAYERERYDEARRILRPIAERLADVAAVRELYGLVLYRLGQWQLAARQLEAYRTMTGSYDQHPVLADCYRALQRYDDADALWDDLRQASPDGDVVAEGRIVAAGCRADRGDLSGAIATLERSARHVEHPKDRHLRQWYTLADLYERAGDLPRARELFGRLATADPDAFDVPQRLRALR